MPAINGIYYNHPETNEPGVWVWLAYGSEKNIVGLSNTQMAAIKLIGGTATRMAQLKLALDTDYMKRTELRTSLASLDAETADWLKANPEPYCRYEAATNEYVAQPIVVSFEVLSLGPPPRLQITVSEGASRAVWA